MSISSRSPTSASEHHGRHRGNEIADGYMSDSNFVLTDGKWEVTRVYAESDEDERKRENDVQYQHNQPTGKDAYTAACTRLGIAPSSHILSRLPSSRLSLRHGLLNPASATALSAGLLGNRCIRSLNLGSNLLRDDSARPLLEAIFGNPSLTKLDLSRNLLSDDFGVLIARSLSSPLCALKEVVLAENLFSDGFVEALNKGMLELEEVHGISPLKNLDISNNKICSRVSGVLASILGSCANLVRLNLSWNDLRTDLKTDPINQRGDCSCPFATAALWRPGRLVSLELSFNSLSDAFGVTVGNMLGENDSLSVLDLSRNHLGKSAAMSIASGLRRNRGLRTLKLGWNKLGREGTLCVIRAIGGNPGPLQLEVLRLENTTDAGMEFEAAREADSVIATRSQWVEVVCEYPDRSRTKGNSHTGPISWMNEHPPDVDLNTAYKTRAEKEYDEIMECLANAQPPQTPSPKKTTPRRSGGVNASGTATSLGDKNRSVAQLANLRPATAFSAPPPALCGNGQKAPTFEEEQRPPSSFGPVKEAVAVPVLSVRLKLRAREEARLEAERMAAAEAAAAEEEARKKPNTLSYLKPLNKTVKERTLVEPPSRLVLLGKAGTGTHSSVKLRAKSGWRSSSGERNGTARGLFEQRNGRGNRYARSSPSGSGYVQIKSNNSRGRSPNGTHHSTRGRVQYKGIQSARGRLQYCNRAWAHVKSTGQSTRGRSSSSNRRFDSRGSSSPRQGMRSSTTSRRRRTTRKGWLGHAPPASRSSSRNNRRPVASGTRGHRKSGKSSGLRTGVRPRRGSPKSPRSPPWLSISALAKQEHLALPSRLKLRGE
ncbi:unnamed protein product [Ectocarpus sp. 6 AP-2014]